MTAVVASVCAAGTYLTWAKFKQVAGKKNEDQVPAEILVLLVDTGLGGACYGAIDGY